MWATYNESKVTNAWRSINHCNEKLYFPGQPHSFQGFFQTFPYLWSFSKLFKARKTSILNSATFQTFQDLYEPWSKQLIILHNITLYIFNSFGSDQANKHRKNAQNTQFCGSLPKSECFHYQGEPCFPHFMKIRLHIFYKSCHHRKGQRNRIINSKPLVNMKLHWGCELQSSISRWQILFTRDSAVAQGLCDTLCQILPIAT